VLFGADYWAGLVDWMRDRVAGEGKISTTDLDLFQVTDSPADVVTIIRDAREHRLRAYEPPDSR
jgi:hypothetical protein